MFINGLEAIFACAHLLITFDILLSTVVSRNVTVQ